MEKTITEKLMNIQQNLKAPKSQFNSFGKYNYRNAEDILEAVKPLLVENKVALTLSDTICEIGGRVYVKAVATLKDTQTTEDISVSAFAREEETKKGMDASQVTGASSSYARKYALNGLFAIDDNKDSDTTNNGQKWAKNENSSEEVKVPTKNTESAGRPVSEPKEAPDGYYYCEKCGNILKGATLSSGKQIDHKEVAKRTLKKYGMQLCSECCKDAKPLA